MISQTLYSSGSDEWYTPQDLYDKLNAEFNFNLDPCATPESAKCEMYYTKEQDGLSQKWGGTGSSVIRRIAKSINGLKRLIEKQEKITHLSLC